MIEGHRVLSELKLDRVFSIKSSEAEALRSESKVLAARNILKDGQETRPAKLTSLCDIKEQDARLAIAQPCYDAAQQELAFINYLIGKVEELTGPVTAYDYQKIQPIENALDIVARTNTSVIYSGDVHPDLWNEARCSPYRDELVSVMYNWKETLNSPICQGTPLMASRTNFEVMVVSRASNIAKEFKLLNMNLITYPTQEDIQCLIPQASALLISNTTC